MEACNLCPRRCGAARGLSRAESGTLGACGMGRLPVVARAGLHRWEEPCISGARGSGTVFFSGCSLRCCFCQNHAISAGGFGEEIPVSRLREIYRELIAQGAHNINLVNPSHFAGAVADSLPEPLPVPVVYNSGGYDSLGALRLLAGKVQIYLPDLKYADPELARRYSGAADYVEASRDAVLEMFRQTGPCRMGADGLLQSGVIIRHLVLPGEAGAQNAFGVIDWVAERFRPGEVLFSLMRQYTPCHRAADYPELSRPLSGAEYRRVEEYLLCTPIEDGFLQEEDAVGAEYIPPFDLTGVRPVPTP